MKTVRFLGQIMFVVVLTQPLAAQLAGPSASETRLQTAVRLEDAIWFHQECLKEPFLNPEYPNLKPTTQLPIISFDAEGWPLSATLLGTEGSLSAAYQIFGQTPENFQLRETLFDAEANYLAVLEYRYLDGQLRSIDRLGEATAKLLRIDRDYAGRISALTSELWQREFFYDAKGRLRQLDLMTSAGESVSWLWQWDEGGFLTWEYQFEDGTIVAAVRYLYDNDGSLASSQTYIAHDALLIPITKNGADDY